MGSGLPKPMVINNITNKLWTLPFSFFFTLKVLKPSATIVYST